MFCKILSCLEECIIEDGGHLQPTTFSHKTFILGILKYTFSYFVVQVNTICPILYLKYLKLIFAIMVYRIEIIILKSNIISLMLSEIKKIYIFGVVCSLISLGKELKYYNL